MNQRWSIPTTAMELREISENGESLSAGCDIGQLHSSSGEDYDTELETDFEPRVATPALKPRDLYLRLCEQLGVTPSTRFLKHLDEKHMDLAHQGLGVRGVKPMCSVLELSHRLVSLNLADNNLQAEGTRHVLYSIRSLRHLTTLDISRNHLGSAGAEAVCLALKRNKVITKVNLADNDFTDNDGTWIRQLLERNHTMLEMDLSYNHFSVFGAVEIGKGLAINYTLQHLNLMWNQIRLKGAAAIAQAFKVNHKIQTLQLAFNGISDNGMAMLAKSLYRNKGLQDLDVSNNRIGPKGAKYISKLLKKNETLLILHIGHNFLSFSGTDNIIKAIEENQLLPLQYLDLSDVPITKEFVEIAERLKTIRRDFDYEYGNVASAADKEGDMLPYDQRNPLEILLVVMSERNLRLVDLFKSLDKDGSFSLSRDEFIHGLQSVNIDLREAQMDALLEMLDKDGDGEIDLKEIMNINVEFRHIKMKADKEVKQKRKLKLKALRDRKNRLSSDVPAVAKPSHSPVSSDGEEGDLMTELFKTRDETLALKRKESRNDMKIQNALTALKWAGKHTLTIVEDDN